MKKHLFSIITPLLFLSFLFNSCGIAEESKAAEKVAEEFYKSLSDKDYDKAVELADEELLKITPEEDLRAILKQKEDLGEFHGFQKNGGFNIHTNNGVTTTELNYTCDYDKYKLYERFTMIKRADGYKIRMYQYNSDKSMLE